MLENKNYLYVLLSFFCISIFSQKKKLDHKDFDVWNTIQMPTISSDGEYVMYSLVKGEKDSNLKIKDSKGNLIIDHERSQNGKFTYDSKFVVFTIKAWKDSITELKRSKLSKDEMPKDSIGIFNLHKKHLEKIANIKSYKLPEKWSNYIAYTFENVAHNSTSKSKKNKDTLKSKSIKKPSPKNGHHMIIRNLTTSKEDTIPFVTNYSFAKEGNVLAYSTTGANKKYKPGVYVKDLISNKEKYVFDSHQKTKYFNLSLSDSGNNIGFVIDTDSTKSYKRPYQLYTWNKKNEKARLIVDNQNSPTGYKVSPDGKIKFSKDENKLFFGLALPEIVQDTLLLDEEIVNVEVWTYDEPRLYTIQEIQAKNDRKKSFETVYHLKENKLVQIGNKNFPNALLPSNYDGNHALISNPSPYQLTSQWTGQFYKHDLSVVNLETGLSKTIIKGNPSSARFSPKGTFVFGYNQVDSTWYTYNLKTEKYLELTRGKIFYNELNDSPNFPSSYGYAGWTKNDKSIIIYDRYDLWEFDPNKGIGKRLTVGRENKVTYRHVKLDPNDDYIDINKKMLFTTFNNISKNSGYFEYQYNKSQGYQLLDGPYRYSTPKKARLNEKVIFSRQSFSEYPNIRISDLSFKTELLISDANPQQKDYNWGTIELVSWSSLDGLALNGMLVKPEDFDPTKKYPMIVNFYEKSSDGIHTYRTPSPGRSSINYSFYASRGYLIFNPDVYYRVGYPGDSAFNCVIPGVTSLIEKGFVDEDNIGVQGHSWGGYQIAHLVTKTDIFKAAESGAPVVNMISAFGGIRWDTGLSRQFQYEHTQSRIGGSPWEYPQRYYDNSPIYNIDKINTPLLIMHNDADGHVPWYQGIEFFVSLRRLGKPSWLLNYNGARHWPLKMQNRKDFNIRMQQFFDHYLKGAPKPMWMVRGVPAIEKGINQGYELQEN